MFPDIGAVFGPYTYLATEVAFGSVAFALLRRAGALARAGKTIVALYPIAYVWDWYTLEIGIFDVILRTGVDLLGIPIEEHLFMIVVPALIIAIHETIHDGTGQYGGRYHTTPLSAGITRFSMSNRPDDPRDSRRSRGGERACYLWICSVCDATCTIADERCPDCGAVPESEPTGK